MTKVTLHTDMYTCIHTDNIGVCKHKLLAPTLPLTHSLDTTAYLLSECLDGDSSLKSECESNNCIQHTQTHTFPMMLPTSCVRDKKNQSYFQQHIYKNFYFTISFNLSAYHVT